MFHTFILPLNLFYFKFSDTLLETNERVVGCSLAESAESQDTDIFIKFPDRANWAVIDRQSFNSTLSAIANSRGASEAERKKQAIELITSSVSDPSLKKELQEFLLKFDLNELLAAENQGLAGVDIHRDTVVGTAKGGHYVNSILSSVRELIRENRFTPEVMGALKKLESADIHDTLKSQKPGLIRSALQDIAFPNTINQHSKGTCSVTTLQIMLAIQKPERYLEILTDLVSPKGESSKIPDNQSGDKLKRQDATMTDDGSGRSISSRIVQAAFMDYANNDDVYDNATDLSSKKETNPVTKKTTDKVYEGINVEDLYGLFIALTEKKDYARYGILSQELKGLASILKVEPVPSNAELTETVAKHLSQRQEPVPVSLHWGKSAHQVLVTAIKDDKVYFMNPWGELQTMPKSEFEKRIYSAIADKKLSPENNNPDASLRLPYPANDLSRYTPIEDAKYKKVSDRLAEAKVEPALAKVLEEKFDKLKIYPDYLDYAFDAIKDGKLNNTLLSRLNSSNSDYDVLQLLRLAGNLSQAVKANTLTEEQANKLLETLNIATAEELSNLSENLKLLVKNNTLTQEEVTVIFGEVIKPTETNNISSAKLNSARNLLEAFKQADPLIKKGFLKAEDVKKDIMNIFSAENKDSNSLISPLRTQKTFYQNCSQTLKECQLLISSGYVSSEQINKLIADLISSGDSQQANDMLQFAIDAKKLINSGFIKPETLKADIARIMGKSPKDASNIIKVYSQVSSIVDSSARLTGEGAIKRDDTQSLIDGLIKTKNTEKAEKFANAFKSLDASFVSANNLMKKGIITKDDFNKIIQDAFKTQNTVKMQKVGNMFTNFTLIYNRSQNLISQGVIKQEDINSAIQSILKNKDPEKAEKFAKLLLAIDTLIKKEGLSSEDANKSILKFLKGNPQTANNYIKIYEEKYKASDIDGILGIKESMEDIGAKKNIFGGKL